MSRQEIIQVLDGVHPTRGPWIAYTHQALILASAITISLETIEGLPAWADQTLDMFEHFILLVFAVEYVTRIICAKHPLRYIFSFWGVIDLLACAPLLALINPEWAALRIFRLMRLLWLVKLMHSNRALDRLYRALAASRGELLVFIVMSCIILYIAAVGIYIFEHEAQPEAFSSIPESLWWAVVSFTTVGYGDIYPITNAGKLFTSGILFVGLGVIAVPAAIITTALVNSDLRDRLEQDMEEDIRRDLRKDIKNLKRKTKRTP